MTDEKTVFVGNIDHDATDEEIKEAIHSVGDLEKLVVMRDRETGKSRGFAFATFSDATIAKLVIESDPGLSLNGRRMRFAEATKRTKERKEKLPEWAAAFLDAVSSSWNE